MRERRTEKQHDRKTDRYMDWEQDTDCEDRMTERKTDWERDAVWMRGSGRQNDCIRKEIDWETDLGRDKRQRVLSHWIKTAMWHNMNMNNQKSIFSRVLRDSTPRYVGPSVGQSVGRLVGPLFTFSAFLSYFILPLRPKCSSDLLQHCSCPPARD